MSENDGAPGWTSGPDGLGLPDASGDAALDLPAEGSGPARHPFAVTEGRRYEEVAELGRGGMGRVVLAVDQRLQADVGAHAAALSGRTHTAQAV